MDPPDGILTNIYCLGSSADVAWISYTYDSKDGSTDRNFSLNALYVSDLAIRRAGGYANPDTQANRLWIFDVFEGLSSTDSDSSDFQNAIKIAQSHGLRETDRGILHSQGNSPLDDASNDINVFGKRGRSDEATEFMRANATAVTKNQSLESSNSSFMAAEDLKSHDIARDCLLQAIQASCIMAVVKSQHYISLGPGFFCSTDRSEYDPNLVMPNGNLDEGILRTPLWSLRVLWHASGAFVISCNRIIHKNIESLTAETESNIVLAPMGWTARAPYRRDLNQESTGTLPGSGHIWRSQCIHLIRQHGLQIEDDLEWVMVELNTIDGSNSSEVIEWPHRFCFIVSNRSERVTKKTSLMLRNKGWIDPLQEAAEWLNDAKHREKLVKEQLLARLGKSHTRIFKNLAEEEVLAHLQSRHEEGLDAQTIAGIYPTPPDVNKNHSHIHTEANPSLLGQSEESRPSISKDDRNTRNLTPALDASVGITNYDPLKDDDLFADMDGGMDGDNGVTEDDFRFFDEPEEAELLISEPDMIDDIGQESVTDIPRDIDEENLESAEVTYDTNINAPDIRDVVAIEAVVSAITDLTSGNPVTPDASSATVILIKEPILNIIPQQTLDAKYSSTGKYAWVDAQKPLTTTPFTRIEQDKGVPLIRDILISTPSSASTPASEPFQVPGPSQETHDIISDEINLFQKQARMLDVFVSTCKTFHITGKSDKHERDRQGTSISVSPKMLEHQSHGSIQLAQIVADQSIFFDYLLQEPDRISELSTFSYTPDLISDILQNRFPQNQALTVHQCAKIEQNFSPVDDRGTSFSVLSPSVVRVKRADSTLELSNTALDFWKELSIKPLHGPKDITAFCICEEGEAYRMGSTLFLQSMEDIYRSLNLGTHAPGHSSLKSCPEGVVSVPGLLSYTGNIKTMDNFCNQLGKSLSALAIVKTTIVLYVVKPDDSSASLTSLCVLFQKIFEAYAAMFRKTDQPSDLVLQIIPLDMITSGMQRVLPNLKHHVTISKIVYNRCPLTNPTNSAYASASTVQLAQPLPASIDFRLSSDNSVHPSATTEIFHLAYSYSEESRWLSAAMVDSSGSKQWNASYHLGDYKDLNFVLNAIIHEIWEIVRLATDYRKTYNLFIVKTTNWSTFEAETWKNLAHAAKVPVFMLTYDASCPITLNECNSKLQLDTLESELSAVPPTPDVSSPDPIGTKGEDQDALQRLVDTRNQAWCIVTKQIMAMEEEYLVVREYLACGYMIYKNTPVIGLSMVASTHAIDMMAIMEAYHGLRALARARCVHNYLPWHLAVAEGAQLGLETHLSQYGMA